VSIAAVLLVMSGAFASIGRRGGVVAPRREWVPSGVKLPITAFACEHATLIE
jgi:hypothetical protein